MEGGMKGGGGNGATTDAPLHGEVRQHLKNGGSVEKGSEGARDTEKEYNKNKKKVCRSN